MKTLDEILVNVEKPSRYIGGEFGEPDLKWNKFNFCICFPDVYEVAMSNLGIRIVNEVINRVEGCCADRCYAPWPDLGNAIKENKIPSAYHFIIGNNISDTLSFYNREKCTFL